MLDCLGGGGGGVIESTSLKPEDLSFLCFCGIYFRNAYDAGGQGAIALCF
jgi:hypothetical protein